MFDKISIYKNKKVLVTGNTGFKGSWMTMWLLKQGANVIGYSLEPSTSPSIYNQLGLEKRVKQYTNDVRSYVDIKKCIQETQPDIIFHLAAQPLVRDSYLLPLETFDVNIMGTANLLEAVRELRISTKIVCVTSDKSYENKEWLFGYREVDPMGGYDPYSASKGAAELVISSYRRSFFNPSKVDEHGVQVASVRAGNVIGGGDWAKDRIVPDCIRSLTSGKEIHVRNPHATRSWLHVLEPVGGYLLLGAKLFEPGVNNELFCEGFNFGSYLSANKSVRVLVEEILENWGEGTWSHDNVESVHEASLLNLAIDKSYHLLKWQPVWGYVETIKRTVEWYKHNYDKNEMFEFTENQINEYVQAFDSKNEKI